MTLEEYLDMTSEKWSLTGKKQYTVRAGTVSAELSFHNELENADYTVRDDGETVVLKGTAGEMWTSPLSKVVRTYTKPDGSRLSEADFAVKDSFIDIVTVSAPDSNFAMFVPKEITVTVKTACGDILHANLPGVPHGKGDRLVCNAGKDGRPDLSDIWVVNGKIFSDTYFDGE